MAGLENQYKEWFSRAFLQAATASAAVSMQLVHDDVYGVDVTLRDGYTAVDVQLKATASPQFHESGDILFDLDVPTYEKLSPTHRDISAYLVLVVVDPDRSMWVTEDHAGTHLHDRAYWLKLTGLPSTDNTATVRLRIPSSQTLTAQAVRLIIENERKVFVA